MRQKRPKNHFFKRLFFSLCALIHCALIICIGLLKRFKSTVSKMRTIFMTLISMYTFECCPFICVHKAIYNMSHSLEWFVNIATRTPSSDTLETFRNHVPPYYEH